MGKKTNIAIWSGLTAAALASLAFAGSTIYNAVNKPSSRPQPKQESQLETILGDNWYAQAHQEHTHTIDDKEITELALTLKNDPYQASSVDVIVHFVGENEGEARVAHDAFNEAVRIYERGAQREGTLARATPYIVEQLADRANNSVSAGAASITERDEEEIKTLGNYNRPADHIFIDYNEATALLGAVRTDIEPLKIHIPKGAEPQTPEQYRIPREPAPESEPISEPDYNRVTSWKSRWPHSGFGPYRDH